MHIIKDITSDKGDLDELFVYNPCTQCREMKYCTCMINVLFSVASLKNLISYWPLYLFLMKTCRKNTVSPKGPIIQGDHPVQWWACWCGLAISGLSLWCSCVKGLVNYGKNQESPERNGKGERKEVGVAGGSGIFISATLHLYRALFFWSASLSNVTGNHDPDKSNRMYCNSRGEGEK